MPRARCLRVRRRRRVAPPRVARTYRTAAPTEHPTRLDRPQSGPGDASAARQEAAAVVLTGDARPQPRLARRRPRPWDRVERCCRLPRLTAREQRWIAEWASRWASEGRRRLDDGPEVALSGPPPRIGASLMSASRRGPFSRVPRTIPKAHECREPVLQESSSEDESSGLNRCRK
jgi:hypothetical protein